LTTNSFGIRLKTANYIFVYDVQFSADIPPSNTPLRKTILRGLREPLEQAFKLYLFTGTLLYSPTDIGSEPLSHSYVLGPMECDVSISRVHMISMQDLVNPHQDPAKAQTATNFLNILIKSVLSACNMYPVGRQDKYLLPQEAKRLPDYGLEVWPGYYTSVKWFDAGLVLEVDYASRILREDSVYSYIRQKERDCGDTLKEVLKEELVGRSVLARYGNKRTYVVSDIAFNTSPRTGVFQTPEGSLSVDEYFQKKYLLHIKDKNQPLLVSKLRQKNGKREDVYLVPELCSLTGLPSELREDRTAMKQLAAYTKLTPEQRAREAERLLRCFSRPEKFEGGNGPKCRGDDKSRGMGGCSAEKLLQDWHLEIDMAPKEVEGRVLPAQEIQLANSRSLKVNEAGQFFFKERVMSPLAFDKWLLVHSERDTSLAEQFVSVLYKAAQTFGIAINYPKYIRCSGVRAKDIIVALESGQPNYAAAQMIVFVLPPPSYGEYASLKKYATQHNPPLLTQMVKSKTLQNAKNLMAVCSKLVLQMNAKRNGQLWRVVTPDVIPRKTMVVGIDISKEGRNSCLGFASSYDPHFTHFYTQIIPLQSRQDICASLGILFVKALDTFLKETKKFLPDLIVIYRDGLSETQRHAMLKAELEQMLKAMRTKFADYNPKLIYATINKKVHTRFYAKVGTENRRGTNEHGNLSNARPGTVIHSGIVDSRKYEFLLMPQYVNEGSGTPSRIYVLHDTSGLSLDTFEEFTNSLCYDYYNWQGAIRCPAPCKYAFAHARLVAKHTKVGPAPQLLSYLYFL
jgi:aubergine-like protein